MTIEQLFFSLIRIAIGTQDTLPHIPSKEEWMELYAMAKKQSLVGIGFAALQKLSLTPNPLTFVEPRLHSEVREQALTPLVCTSLPTRRGEYLAEASEDLEPCEVMAKYWNMPEMLYLKWMGMAAKIQQRNEIVNEQCRQLLRKIQKDGKACRLLKGQGVASLYKVRGEGLEVRDISMLRQSGDIDVWIVPYDKESEDEHFMNTIQYVKTLGDIDEFNRQHAQMHIFRETEVEIHFVPSRMNNPWHNKRLQKFCIKEGKNYVVNDDLVTPTSDFNIVYLLQHCYNHFLFEGVGLRQTMDYYFALKEASLQLSPEGKRESVQKIKQLGMKRFAKAMAWVIAHIFANDDHDDNFFLGIKPNEKEGRFLLEEIMNGGNFGKYGKDGVMEGHDKGKVAFFMARMKRNWRFLVHYPSEIIWSPYAMLSHYFWKRAMNNKL